MNGFAGLQIQMPRRKRIEMESLRFAKGSVKAFAVCALGNRGIAYRNGMWVHEVVGMSTASQYTTTRVGILLELAPEDFQVGRLKSGITRFAEGRSGNPINKRCGDFSCICVGGAVRNRLGAVVGWVNPKLHYYNASKETYFMFV